MKIFSDQRRRSRRTWFGSAIVCLVTCLLLPARSPGQTEQDLAEQPAVPSHGPVYISDTQIGFADGGRNLARSDYSVPARVSVTNRTGDIFTGTVQILGTDRDGETVIYERSGIGIKPSDTADIVMSCFVRARGSFQTNLTEVTVRLLDKDNHLVHSLDAPLDFVLENEYLVVDISPKTVKGLVQGLFMDVPAARYRGKVRTSYMRAVDVPAVWHDLEAADVVVCDEPEDARLNPDQWNALTQWVRQGGLLVLGPGSMQSLDRTDLAKELPATAQTITKVTLDDFAGAAASDDTSSRRARATGPRAVGIENSFLKLGFVKEMGVWQLKPKADATVLLTLPLTRGDLPVVVRRRLGEGSIAQSAISLSLLLSNKVEEGLSAGVGTRVKPEIFGIRTLDAADNTTQAGGWSWSWPSQYGPAELVAGDADFRAAGTILATLLMLLTIIYGLVVTLGTWLVLRRRKLTQHAWLAFGLVAAAGSVGAGFLVQGARGIRSEVKQQSVIDLDTRSGMASVRTFYGVRVPYDARVDVSLTAHRADELPPEQARDAYVRPAGNLQVASDDSFAVRRDYTIRYGQNLIKDVPVRATAKQFESYWYGPLGGNIGGSIVLEDAGRRLSSRSSLSNQTDMDLRECVLVFARTPAFDPGIRSSFISVVRIGRLPAGEVRSNLTPQSGTTGDNSGILDKDSGLDETTKTWFQKAAWTMPAYQPYGQSSEGPVDRSDVTRSLAATMVTLLSDLPTFTRQTNAWGGGMTNMVPYVSLPRSGNRWLDMRNVLDGRSAVLIGLADSPGPTRLRLDGRTAEPSSGQCIVRAIVPLQGVSD